MRLAIIDAETYAPVQRGLENRIDGILYAQSWDDLHGMGISTVCGYDTAEERYRVFCGDGHAAFAEWIKQCDGVVTFNGKRFDLPLIETCWGIKLDPNRHYDILRELWIQAGLNPDQYRGATHGSFKLDNIAKANIGYEKTGDGALAPILWQQGKISQVIDYCLADVWLTKKIFDLIIRDRKLLTTRGKELSMPTPAGLFLELASGLPRRGSDAAKLFD